MSVDYAKEFVELNDTTTGCISKNSRAAVAGHIVAQFGVGIPIYTLTQRGKELLLERAKEVESPILINTQTSGGTRREATISACVMAAM